MVKFVLAAAFVALAMPVLAAENLVAKCDENTMMRLDKMVNDTTDPAKKDVAMKELDLAKDSMNNGKLNACVDHMRSAYDSAK